MRENEFERRLIEELDHGKLHVEVREENLPALRPKNWTYEKNIKTTEQLWENFKRILEQHNQDKLDRPLSVTEFAQVKRVIEELNTPFKAGQFLYGMNGVSQVEVDLDDGKHVFLTVFDQSQVGAGSTVYQVVNQIDRPAVITGKKDRRFDVTLLINGLPIIQIELKKDTHTVSEAFNQMHQYAEEGQFTGIFSTLQILIGMTPNNVRYMANITAENFNRSFFFHWQNPKSGEVVRDWKEFTDYFLSVGMGHKMATNYMILDGTENHEMLKVMRPYQVEATEKVLEKIKNYDFTGGNGKLGYVWHTTGSGKTITSFKTAWLASKLPNVDKVVFLVDRKALTQQTLDEYRAYDPEGTSGGAAEGASFSKVQDTENTKELKDRLNDNSDDIIITSVQKMQRLVKNKNFNAPDKNIVFIVDEAHRSTGGEAFSDIQKKFSHAAWVGYTGTPMFDDIKGKNSTKEIFGDLLHAYTIREAIADQNVLGFQVDFMNTIPEEAVKNDYLPAFFKNEHPEWDDETIQHRIRTMTEADMDDSISRSFYDNNEAHVKAVVKDIMTNWRNRSAEGKYNGMLTTHVGGQKASTPMAMMYFREFMRANETGEYGQKLKIAATFSLDTSNGDNMVEVNKGLEEAIRYYNKQFGTNFDLTTIEEYKEDLAQRIRRNNKEGDNLDLVIVVDQLLTGFDAPKVNTLYVDRTLKGAGLIQAYSRTNRLDDRQFKPYGHIVNYRWPKENERLMNEALSVYSNKDSAAVQTGVLDGDDGPIAPNVLVKKFKERVEDTKEILKTIDKLTKHYGKIPPSEGERKELLKKIRQYTRNLSALKQYAPQRDEDGQITPGTGYDYDNPNALLDEIGIAEDDHIRLVTTLLHELIEVIGKNTPGNPPGDEPYIQLNLKVELFKEVEVNYDYLTKLLEDLANQVHEGKTEEAEATREEIRKFALGLEDRRYAKKIERAAEAIADRQFPPADSELKYPFSLTSSQNIIEDIEHVIQTNDMQSFIEKWGLQDVITDDELLKILQNHIYGEDDLNGNKQITELLKKASKTYKEKAGSHEVIDLSKIAYRIELRQAIKESADRLVQS